MAIGAGLANLAKMSGAMHSYPRGGHQCHLRGVSTVNKELYTFTKISKSELHVAALQVPGWKKRQLIISGHQGTSGSKCTKCSALPQARSCIPEPELRRFTIARGAVRTHLLAPSLTEHAGTWLLEVPGGFQHALADIARRSQLGIPW